MSTLTINDLEFDRELDRAAMSAIGGGGGAPWVYGWMTPYVSDQRSQQGLGSGIVNIYDISNTVTNNVSVGQMINQYQTVDVKNTGNGAMIGVTPNAVSANGLS